MNIERERISMQAFALLCFLVSLGYDNLQYSDIYDGLEYINSKNVKDLEADWVKGRS